MNKKSRKTATKKVVSKPYEPTPREQSVVTEFRARRKEKIPLPQILVKEGANGVPSLEPNHPDTSVGHILLMQSLGTTDFGFLNGILQQIANAGS